jgi:hypothetical protein
MRCRLTRNIVEFPFGDIRARKGLLGCPCNSTARKIL